MFGSLKGKQPKFTEKRYPGVTFSRAHRKHADAQNH